MTTTGIRPAPLEGTHLHRSSDGGGVDGGHLFWQVRVWSDDGVVKRQISRGQQHDQLRKWPHGHDEKHEAWKSWQPEETIWPSWSPSLAPPDDRHLTPLHEVREHWTTLGDRLREAAKWMSTVLGAAIGLFIGTSPLGELGKVSFNATGTAWGMAGLGLLFVTLLLLLRVLQPGVVSFEAVQKSDQDGVRTRMDPLVRWKQEAESQQDLYLPCGISSLYGLRVAIIVEEATIGALAGAIQQAATARSRAPGPAADARQQELEEAARARIARLHDLKDAVGEVAAVGEFYVLLQRTWTACIVGGACTAAGIACVITGLAALHG